MNTSNTPRLYGDHQRFDYGSQEDEPEVREPGLWLKLTQYGGVMAILMFAAGSCTLPV